MMPGRFVASDARSILIVDDDVGTCETFRWALSRDGYVTEAAGTGAEALRLAASSRFDLLLIDLRLPDMLGTDLARAIAAAMPLSFVLMSAYLTTAATVEAMKLGAATVAEKPMSVQALSEMIASLFGDARRLRGCDRRAWSGAGSLADAMPPASLAQRWARYVLKGSRSDVDLMSVGDWARHVGASTTSISESCRLLGIGPRDARDLMRLLRVVMLSAVHLCPPEALLLVSDSRTLKSLFERGGLPLGARTGHISAEQYLDSQRFVAPENEGLRVLRMLLRQR